jgi:hypothetical protein
MRRRDFLASIVAGTAASWPLVGRAQQTMPVIGFLNVATREGYKSNLAAFQEV